MNNIVIVLVIASVLAIVNRPYWGIVILIGLLPVENALTGEIFNFSITVLIGGLTFVVFLLKSTIHKHRWILTPPFIVAFFLFLFVAFSYYTSPSELTDRNWALTYLQLVILFWLVEQMFLSIHRIEILFLVFCSVTLFVGSLDIYQWVEGGFAQFLTVQTSTILGPNQAARYYLLSTIILVFFMLKAQTVLPRIGFFIAILSQILAILITGSKTTLLLLWIALILTLLHVMLTKNHRRYALIITVSVFILSSLLNLVPLYTDVIFPLIRAETGTYGLRVILQDAGIAMFLDNPIIGVGIGQFPSGLDEYGYQVGYRRTHNLTAHNMYIQMLAEMGVIGFSLFMILIITAILNLIKILRQSLNKPSEMDAIIWQIFIMLMVVLVGGWTKTDGANKEFWLLLALACSAHHIVPSPKSNFP